MIREEKHKKLVYNLSVLNKYISWAYTIKLLYMKNRF